MVTVPNSISLLVLGVALACGCAKTSEPVCEAPGLVDDGTCSTAILNIIASPASYAGKKVSVLGFVDVISDGNHGALLLYPSRDARAMQAMTTAIRVRGEGRQLERIRGSHRVDAPAHAAGVFVQADAARGVVGEIRVSTE
jgi:hypothetical protein